MFTTAALTKFFLVYEPVTVKYVSRNVMALRRVSRAVACMDECCISSLFIDCIRVAYAAPQSGINGTPDC